MKRLWITGACLLFLLPSAIQAEEADFLLPQVHAVERSLVCEGWDDGGCRTIFLISGKNFLNSNGDPGVRVGDEWADIIRQADNYLVAVASESSFDLTPSIAVDKTLQRPVMLTSDNTLSTMFAESVEVVLESIGITDKGLRYVTAGPKYGNPERVYYRDTYWTSGMVLMIEPYILRDQIELLARGIEPNGSVPSAIPVDPNDAMIPLWIDHQDAGLYFIRLVYDYIAWTGDDSILAKRVNGRTIFTAMEDIVSYLSTKDLDGNHLPEKPEGSLQDWLDSIPRSGEVISNQALYYRALRDLVEFSEIYGEPTHAKAFHRQSLLVRYQINSLMWNEDGGYFYERCDAGVCEDRITNESALTILYDVVWPERRAEMFEALGTLETARNDEIPYGDWGTLNAWPLYDGFTPHDYQNGTDWPFLDGINAGARLKYNNDDWWYPMTRWWRYNQENSSKTLPEYVSPVDDDSGDLQAWSVNPIVSFVKYGLGLDPTLDGTFTTKGSPAGDMRLENVALNGTRSSIDFPAR
ncbi:MAG: hypothetical protein HQ488_03510 [Parcubacteria group bacterium]|nr:hypothetical protein [Parcubacteria group bacterium]